MNSILTLILFFLLSGIAAASCPGTSADCYTKTGTNPHTYTAIDCSQPAVQASVNASSDGDTVIIPAGSCSWTPASAKYPAVYALNKAITLIGAGIGQTVINFSGGTGWDFPGESVIIFRRTTTVAPCRISGFTINRTPASSYPTILLDGKWAGYRIDHIKFNITQARAIMVTSGAAPAPYGLIDSNYFYPQKGTGYAQQVLFQSYAGSPAGETEWSGETRLGSKTLSYFENNYVEYPANSGALSPVIDADYGGSFVARYNTFIQTHIHAHGGYEYASYPKSDRRGTRQFEIYNNTFTATSKLIGTSAIQIRGGVGVVFNNTVKGNYGNAASGTAFGFYCYSAAARSCNGSRAEDQNLTGKNGRHCRDCPGTGQNIAPFPGAQSLEPTYVWNNTQNGSAGIGGTNIPAYVVIGEDVINGKAKPGYTYIACPHYLSGLKGSCNPSVAGIEGYNVGNKKD